MKKYAFITRTGLYPPKSGSALRNRQNIAGVATLGEVGVFSVLGKNEPSSTQIPKSIFLREVSVKDRRNPLSRLVTDVIPGGVQMADKYRVRNILCELDRFLDDFSPDVLIAEELAVGALVRYAARRNHLPFVFDDHNFEKDLRIALAKETKRFPQRVLRRFRAGKVGLLEQRLCRSAAQVWCCSDVDKNKLLQNYPGTKPIHLISNGIDVIAYQQPETMCSDNPAVQKKYLFVGRYSYLPNYEAAVELVRDIMPFLKEQIPSVQLVLVGHGPPELLLSFVKDMPNICMTGQVENAIPYYWEAEALLVPLRHGSGTRLKILEAMAAGCPVISTRLGAEGLGVANGVNILYAENAGEFAQQARRLVEDPGLKKRIVASARDLVKKFYSYEVTGALIKTALQAGGLV